MSVNQPIAIEATALATHLAAAHAAWPSLQFGDADYTAWLREALVAFDDPAAQFAKIDAGVAALCWSAGRCDPEAHRLFELHFVPHIAPALARFGTDRDFAAEIAQRIRMKFLVAAPGELAPIAGYGLRGNLVSLIRVAAVREAINAKRYEKSVEPVEAAEELAGDHDPALRVLKVRYAADFERAFTAAVAELSTRDRQLLRLSISMNASIDDIAK